MARKKKRRVFSPEFKAKVVGHCRTGSRSVVQVAEDLELTESSLRSWANQSKVDAGDGPPDALTTAETEELTRLRREIKQLRQEREIPRAAGKSVDSARPRTRTTSSPFPPICAGSGLLEESPESGVGDGCDSDMHCHWLARSRRYAGPLQSGSGGLGNELEERHGARARSPR